MTTWDRKLGRKLRTTKRFKKMPYSSRLRWAIIWLADGDDNYGYTARSASKALHGHKTFWDVLRNKKRTPSK